jgi:hypothetical protein
VLENVVLFLIKVLLRFKEEFKDVSMAKIE